MSALQENIPPAMPTTPKTYPVRRRPDGRIGVEMRTPTRTLYKTEEVIYRWRNKRTEERLVGATSQTVADRLYSYHTDINGEKKDSRFLADIRETPEDFDFAVYPTRSDDLRKEERRVIAANDSYERGYNQNRGGGGGVPSIIVTPMSPRSAVAAERPNFLTPEKTYPFRRDAKRNRVVVDLTPNVKRQRGLIYTICRREEGHPTKHKVGLTGQEARRRVSQHVHMINRHPETDPLYAEISEDPEAFEFAVLHRSTSRAALPALEQEGIRVKDATRTGYNRNRGGGGGYSQ